jgi:hypothetical protein
MRGWRKKEDGKMEAKKTGAGHGLKSTSEERE